MKKRLMMQHAPGLRFKASVEKGSRGAGQFEQFCTFVSWLPLHGWSLGTQGPV